MQNNTHTGSSVTGGLHCRKQYEFLFLSVNSTALKQLVSSTVGPRLRLMGTVPAPTRMTGSLSTCILSRGDTSASHHSQRPWTHPDCGLLKTDMFRLPCLRQMRPTPFVISSTGCSQTVKWLIIYGLPMTLALLRNLLSTIENNS